MNDRFDHAPLEEKMLHSDSHSSPTTPEHLKAVPGPMPVPMPASAELQRAVSEPDLRSVESQAFTDAQGQRVHVQLSSSNLSIASTQDGRSRTLDYDVDDLVGCLYDAQQSTTRLALHFYPQVNRSCFATPGPPDRSHVELLLIADEHDTAARWHGYLNRAAHRLPINDLPHPPRQLIILVNPASGTGESVKRAEALRPLFLHSGLPFTITPTTHAGHAHSLVHSLPLSHPTSVVCVSGDGLIYEVVNGLLSRPDLAHVTQQVTLGAIASGSANGLARSITGASMESYSLLCQAYLVVKGYQRPLDIATVVQAGHAPVFSFVSLSWAMISDIDLASEKYRWMGDFRFTFAGVLQMLKPPHHRARMQYIRRAQPTAQDKAAAVHDKHEALTVRPRRRSLPPPSSCGLHTQCAHCLGEQPSELSELSEYLSYVNESRQWRDCDEDGVRWEEVEDDFTILWALNIPWVTKDWLVAPCAHFSDGLIDLLFVRHMSGLGAFRMFMKMGDGTHTRRPEVEYVKVKAIRLSPHAAQGEECNMSVDGEKCPYSPVEMRQWRGILQMHSK